MIGIYTQRLRFVLDAVVVIKAHELGIWELLVERAQVLVPATVVRDEAFYFDTEPGEKRYAIKLKDLIDSGKIIEEAASVAELKNLHDIFDSITLEGLDPGETEALAIVKSGRLGEVFFCTSDKAAIRALALMGCSEHGISFEELLKRYGLQKTLDPQYTQDFFNYHLSKGKQDRITGVGLKS
jgi:hypothetical protein